MLGFKRGKMTDTSQLKTWKADFGKDYTDRNTLSPKELDELYQKSHGITRSKLNKMFIGKMNRSTRILEIGANIGNQLLSLQKMGFTDLYGIEPQEYAVECAKKRTTSVNLIKGDASNLPFKDSFFDIVFTSGVLIHINPNYIDKVLNEIYRCSSKYIWGFEYYADKYTEIPYRGHDNLLWKTDFSQLYLDSLRNLKLVKKERVPYLKSDNVNEMFLLEKT